ncbi:serine protease, S1-C subfamily, contains C-terminal PDZ domain [Lutimaribacter pacificus]|uniref:Serine protease, S1-C subfamily, contains C-terminal PDZ domain n=1 Tax=Lutimaribacter pacificus TaxID=391948 RepID=A0A1H0NLA5_9RHOB|nr:trypsin-like peptidase domain-containing protein [Lutimaribacter pacificus]SDO93205.1 serine protease, S1-C subfamily, contains C-terminal PDZ domain [Lutimaribacter pacificus]SHK88444.1 serine protease, S1-C subfamily, contains C-terminal PDZ domain [Lutimaribacter pacificus]
MLKLFGTMAVALVLAASAVAQDLTAPEERLISLFEASRSSVVSITTGQRRVDPWMRRAEIVPSGSGSGFFWGEDGHIVTNAHVIRGAARADIHMSDGRVLPARLVGTAPQFDLAVLRVDLDGTPVEPLENGNSADLRVGQSVLAIGNPFGLDWTLTTGIVSALDREIPIGNGVIEGLIQTDAAINPGNSGGPLLDSSGRLIGVNTAIFSPSGASSGIGFAVPVDLVKRVVPQLIATGVYRPPILGIRFDPRIDALARRNGIEGAVVLSVDPGGPADVAGLRPAERSPHGGIVAGDVIQRVDGQRIASGTDLGAILDDYEPGDRITLTVWRDGETREVTAQLAAP